MEIACCVPAIVDSDGGLCVPLTHISFGTDYHVPFHVTAFPVFLNIQFFALAT